MNFWENVEIEAKYRNITKKEIAIKAGIDASNISRGRRIGCSPSVETAFKVAKALGVTVEYLVTGANSPDVEPSYNLHKLHKYEKTINALESLPAKTRLSIENMIEELSVEYTPDDKVDTKK